MYAETRSYVQSSQVITLVLKRNWSLEFLKAFTPVKNICFYCILFYFCLNKNIHQNTHVCVYIFLYLILESEIFIKSQSINA